MCVVITFGTLDANRVWNQVRMRVGGREEVEESVSPLVCVTTHKGFCDGSIIKYVVPFLGVLWYGLIALLCTHTVTCTPYPIWCTIEGFVQQAIYFHRDFADYGAFRYVNVSQDHIGQQSV